MSTPIVSTPEIHRLNYPQLLQKMQQLKKAKTLQYSHLKGKQDYGHQAVAVMLSCNGIVLNYVFVLYNKSISKIDIVQKIAAELPIPPVLSYFLCDSWYTSEKLINAFAVRGFHTIGALKTNRLLYPGFFRIYPYPETLTYKISLIFKNVKK